MVFFRYAVENKARSDDDNDFGICTCGDLFGGISCGICTVIKHAKLNELTSFESIADLLDHIVTDFTFSHLKDRVKI